MPEELPDGLTEQQLKWGYWFTTHKIGLRRVFYIVFTVLVASMWAFSLFTFLDWWVIGGQSERNQVISLLRDRVDFAGMVERSAPRGLDVLFTKVLPSVSGKSDLLGRVENPSGQWYAEFSYSFGAGDVVTPPQRGFLLPGATGYLAAYAISDVPRGAEPALTITDLNWYRVPAHQVSNYEAWSAARLNFLVRDAVTYDLELGRDYRRTTFSITNNSPFSYRHVPLQIALGRDDAPVAFQEVFIDSFLAGETRTVEASWFQSVPDAMRINVYPVVNLFDSGNYILPEGQAVPDIRDIRYRR